MKQLIILTTTLLLLVGCSSANDTANKTNQEQTKQPETATTEAATPKQEKASTPIRTPSTNVNGKVVKEERTTIKPYRLVIPAIDVDARVEQVGVIENGQMGVPESFETVGWYNEGPLLGERGNTVISGHVDSRNGPAVFFELKDLKPGDEIQVYNDKEVSLTYIVERIETYAEGEAPVEAIFDYSFQSNLILITCTGTFDRSVREYSDRLVVYSSLKK
ncbi:class F sortase [Sutcliffiella deserti]|uniref:class F sortase n=1 Tax=Sutcliffiella deserti TaxID=2875501 RepID=UPI001CC11C05|nr:class F sortase [Sutcliffiella deserti]